MSAVGSDPIGTAAGVPDAGFAGTGGLRVCRPRCEYLVDPLGIDERVPRLSWVVESGRRGATQAAWRVRVASSPAVLAAGAADIWDSGRVADARTCHVEYGGPELRSGQECHWVVQVWDDAGQAATSDPAFWTMGLLRAEEWRARWIACPAAAWDSDSGAVRGTETVPGSAVWFRREFEVPGPVRRATLRATARGLVEVHIAGARVGEDLFAPEWTDYRKRIQVRTYDVTARISPGRNAIGFVLGDGWWSGYVGWQETRGRYGLRNSALIQLEIELETGERMLVGTDAEWSCRIGPILSSDFMMGEVYDARRELAGWSCAGDCGGSAGEGTTGGTGPAGGAGTIAGAGATAGAGTTTGAETTGGTGTTTGVGTSGGAEATLAGEGGGGGLRRDAPGWHGAVVVDSPGVPLVAQRSEPVRVTALLKPVSVAETAPGVHVFNLGQNISGWIRLQVSGERGTRIEIRHGERLNPDGSLYSANLRRALSTDVYILRGGGEEIWEPRFTFHGFQYAEVTGLPGGPKPGCVTGCAVHSAISLTGEFDCSNADVNRLWLNGVWSQRDNFLSVPTDCPQRDERLGWMGDAQVFLRTAASNADVAAFFTKWMVDVVDAQTADGIFPDTAPRLPENDGNYVGLDGLGGGPAWADAGIIVPWTIWRVYGDLRIVERNWDAMVAWLEYLDRTNPSGLRTRELGNNYGDWLCIPSDTSFRTQSPMKNLLATAYWADGAAKLSRMAEALGKPGDAARFAAMERKVRAAFQREFVLPDGRLAVETQTAYLLALAFRLLPECSRARAAERLVDDIRGLDWHLSTGFVGISHLNPVLTETGHADVAYRLLLREDYPSWLYPIRHGATTIWERWNGWTREEGFFNPHMNSFNHYSLGSIGEWLFRFVAGIELDPEIPGYRRFLLQPRPGGGLSHGGAAMETIRGRIESRWRHAGGRFSLDVRIPANTTARIRIPSLQDTAVAEGGVPIESAEGIRVIAREAGALVCEAGAGAYAFTSVFNE